MTDTTSRPSIVATIFAVVALIWMLVCAFATQYTSQILPAFSTTDSEQAVTLISALFVGLVAVPILPLAIFLSESSGRAALRAWLLALTYALLLIPSRLIAPAESQLALFAQIAAALVFAGVLWWVRPRTNQTKSPAAQALAVGVGALAALPWLYYGSLGSLLDTILTVLLGLLTGLITALIIDRTWLAHIRGGFGRSSSLFIDGLVIGGVILPIAVGLLGNGAQLPLMFALPALGWAAAALLSVSERDWRALALLVGVATAAALALIDTDGTGLIAGDPIGSRTSLAGWIAMVLNWLLTFVVLLVQTGVRPERHALPWLGATVAAWLFALIIYFTLGEPGFYGDRLFVIMKDQVDVSQAKSISNYDERRTFVYKTLTDHANTTQADLRATLDRFGVHYTPYYLVNAIEVDGGTLTRLLLETRGDIDRILPSPRLRPLPTPPEPMTGDYPAPNEPDWNITNIGVDKVWELGVRGKGIVIGQSDSGADYTHPELAPTYRGGPNGNHDYNWFDPWTGRDYPFDDGGHGTHTLGTIVGQHVGLAPEAQWIACANLQRNLGDAPLYLSCMQFMLAPFPHNGNPLADGDPTRSANVLNNSWGCPQDFEGCDPASLRPAVEALEDAGIFVVASAGNNGPACSTIADPLAIYDSSYSVGAIDQDGDLASFSSTGPVTVDQSGRIKPDILAPGVNVFSSLPKGTYGPESGTSMAGPHIVGVVALMWSANPALVGNIEQTRQILNNTARPFDGSIRVDIGSANDTCLAQTNLSERPNRVAGYGIVDAYAAVKSAEAFK